MYTLDDLKNCTGCTLHRTRTNPLCGEGSLTAGCMFVAQAPGEQEDKQGRMFVGPSGRIFRRLLKEAEIPVQDIYMTNLVKCVLPRNRRPKQAEIDACSVYLKQEIAGIHPYILAPLGYYATRYLFTEYGLGDFSRREFHVLIGSLVTAGGIRIMPLSHPAALLYNESYEAASKKHYKRLHTFIQRRT